LYILPLLFYNRTADVLELVQQFASSEQAAAMSDTTGSPDNNWLSKVYAALLTRIAIGGRSPQVAGKVLKQMFASGNTIPPASTRHCNIAIEGYRKFQQQSNSRSPSASASSAAIRNKRAALHIWRSMLRFDIAPDKYTLTSMLGLQTESHEIKDLCKYAFNSSSSSSSDRTSTASMSSTGSMAPSGVLCRSMMTELGRVGDASSVCVVFEWMYLCHARMGRTLPWHKIETWNTLLSALASRDMLGSAQPLTNTLSKDMMEVDARLVLPSLSSSATTSSTANANDGGGGEKSSSLRQILPSSFMSMSRILEGMTRIEAVQKVLAHIKIVATR
jgi:hypothetical protein